ncbi:MAG: hypothetical protein K1X89_04830 [Myxococcaceae bacterium]|nr:hypothetical protein [Myxococcaceae bacterium]
MLELLAAAALAAAPALPARVDYPTPTQARAAKHLVAIADGRLWWAPVPADGAAPAWALLPPDGLPQQKVGAVKKLAAKLPGGAPLFERPERLVSLTADGDNLIAVSDQQQVFYAKLSTLEWTHLWGPSGAQRPFFLERPFAVLAASHRMSAYEDLDGNPHPVTVGVSTLYALEEGGQAISYTDPWLPPAFERRICLPNRGDFRAVALAASASTLAVIDAQGHLFTRLADFDTLGEDPALPYSYERKVRRGVAGAVRSLPPEDWQAAPPIPGPHSARLGIHQVGPHNQDRELTVEGDGGLWVRRLDEPAWRFVKTGLPMAGQALPADAGEAPRGQTHRELKGRSTLTGASAEATLDWSFDCSPSPLRVGPRTFELHARRGSVLEAQGPRFKGAVLENGKLLKLVELRATRTGDEVTVEAFDPNDATRTHPLLSVTGPWGP